MKGKSLLPDSCDDPDIGELLLAYLEGELDPDAQQEVRGHLESCESCSLAMAFTVNLRERHREELSRMMMPF